MKRPAFQFYPGDWQRNANLRRCSPAARGVWVDILCLLHDSDEYGLLRWPLKEISQAAGASMSHVRELVEKSVLKGVDKGLCDPFIYTPRSGRKDGDPVTLVQVQDGPVWYSSRMVKDEYVRTVRGESTRFGEAPKTTPKSAPKPPFGDGSSSASATAVKEEDIERATSATVGRAPPGSAGAVCQALRLAGIATVNPAHPTLLVLLAAGATEAEFLGAVPKAKGKRDPFGYLLGVVEGQRQDAANTATTVRTGPPPPQAESFRERDSRLAAERVARWTGGTCHDRNATGEAARQPLPFERGYVPPADVIEGEAHEQRRIEG